MCVPISIVVHPRTLEVWHVPGFWHHSVICDKLGIDYDAVFKPEINLGTKQTKFVDGPIAFTRNLPPELIADIKLLFHKHGCEEDLLASQLEVEVKGIVPWDRKHDLAVNKWASNFISDARQLMEFSCHTWSPEHYSQTLNMSVEANRELSSIMHRRSRIFRPDHRARSLPPLEEYAPGKLVHKAWVKQFMQDANRTYVWTEAAKEHAVVRR